MKRVGLYFGSFNPIHLGHLIIADSMLQSGMFDEIRFVVSPHNPLKTADSLAPAEDRAKMCELAIANSTGLTVSRIEFNLERPSYTIHTLDALQKEEPEVKFHIIIGEDSLLQFHQWKDYHRILNENKVYVFPRRMSDENRAFIRSQNYPVENIDAPLIEISSTFVRRRIQQGLPFDFYVREKVAQYILENGLYLAH